MLAGAWWLVISAEAVAVVERAAKKPEPVPGQPPSPEPSEPLEPPSPTPHLDPVTMIDLPGGRFWMGSEEGDERAYGGERPRHEVEVAPFSMMATTVTQKLYREVMGKDPGRPKGDDLPANNVSWFDAIAFCNRLSDREGLAHAYLTDDGNVTRVPEANGYRLPTEAEWEYALRAALVSAEALAATRSEPSLALLCPTPPALWPSGCGGGATMSYPRALVNHPPAQICARPPPLCGVRSRRRRASAGVRNVGQGVSLARKMS